MRAPRLSAAALALAALASSAASSNDCPPCGAQECALEDPAAKIARHGLMLKLVNAGYPARLAGPLVAKLPGCEKCVQNAPAALWLHIVEEDGTWETQAWTAALERKARQDLRRGRVRAFYVALGGKACQCCVQQNGGWKRQEAPNDRADWDPHLGINRDAVLVFEKVDSLGTEPKDLKKSATAAKTD
jgi:hypothetical protein